MLLSGYREHTLTIKQVGKWVSYAYFTTGEMGHQDHIVLLLNPQRGWRWVLWRESYPKKEVVATSGVFRTDDKALKDYLGNRKGK
jgi:hypothetical protein